jgi:1,2-diacylglycerol 3-beta-glucosyltransferase
MLLDILRRHQPVRLPAELHRTAERIDAMIIFHIANFLLLSLCGSLLLYLAMLSILALISRDRKTYFIPPIRKFAVVIPAHNEESVIGKTLDSIQDLDYPRKKFEVIVVADNCTDRTAEVARRVEAKVYERHDAVHRGKGYALRWIFDKLLTGRSTYDAFVVVDADSIVSRNFLLVMNTYLENGAQVVQAGDLVAAQNAWSVEVTRIGFLLYNYVRPLGRKVLGCSAGLRGNGMCFAAKALKRTPWESYSLTEDMEHGLRLLLNGVVTEFAPEATVLAMMPEQSNNAVTQRARWESGRYPVIAHYGPKLLLTALRLRSYKHLDAFIDLITPPLVNLMMFSFAILLTNALLLLSGVQEASVYILLWVLVCWLGAVHVLVGLVATGNDKSLYRGLLHVPQYALWKLNVYAQLLLFGRTKEWIRTTRETKQ